MEKTEFEKLLGNSGLSKVDAAKLLGVGRQTVYNWLKGSVPIPDSKEDFVRNMLNKSPEDLTRLVNNDGEHTVDSVLPFVVKHFDEFMAHEDFHRKVYIKSYKMAMDIIDGKD